MPPLNSSRPGDPATTFEIDPGLKAFISPHTPEERAQPEQNLLADGRCREPLTVWQGKLVPSQF